MNEKKIMIQYSALQGLYWMLFGTIYAFATVFLRGRGFSGTYIGLIVALGNILGVVLQPTVSSLADKSDSLSVQKLTAILGGVLLAVLAALYLLPHSVLFTAAFFIAADAVLQAMQPLVNSVSVYYINRGLSLNFGLARGIGSVMYAVLSSVLGALVQSRGTELILLAGIVIVLGVMLLAMRMPFFAQAQEAQKTGGRAAQANGSGKSILQFFSHYKFFSITLVGLTCLLLSHNMINSYMIYIVTPLKGDEAAMGTALSVQALMELPTMFFFAWLIKRIASEKLLICSGVFFSLKAASYLISTSMLHIYIFQVFQMGAFALYIPASVYYVNEVMEESDRFKGQALMVGTSTLGGVFGSLVGGVLVDYASVKALLAFSFVIAFLGAVLVALSAGKARKVNDVAY